MKFPVPKTLTGAFAPMLLMNWVFGFGVIEYPMGRPRRMISTFWSIVNLTIFMGLVWTADHSGIAESLESTIVASNYRINACLLPAFVATSMCFARMRAKVVKDTFLTLNGINDRLEQLGIPNDYQLVFKAQIIKLVIVFALTFILMVPRYIIFDFSNDSPRIGWFLYGCYFLMLSSLVNYTFIDIIRYFGNRFRRLNALLVELNSLDRSDATITQSDDKFPRYFSVIREIHGKNSQSIRTARKQWLSYVIRETRMIHRRLRNAATKLNQAFGTQMLMSLALNFNLITSSLYKCYNTAMAPSNDVSIGGYWIPQIVRIMWIMFFTVRVILIADACKATSCEANRTGELVNKLLDTTVHDGDIREEMNIFSLQLLQNPLNLTAFGFLPLDYSLIHRMIGSVTTYLIIMIQMQSIYELENINATPNSTMLMQTNGTD